MAVTWMWAGAVGPDSFTVKAKVSGATVRLVVADNPAMSGPMFFDKENQGSLSVLATMIATGLSPDTQYWYQVEDNGNIDTSVIGKAHTHGPVGEPYSFTFAAITCAGANPDFPDASGGALAPDRVSNHPVFDNVRNQSPLFVAHMGDLHYYNLGQSGSTAGAATVANYRRGYDDVLAQPRQYHLYREVPIVYLYDDHDYGPNNSDGTHSGKGNAGQAYRDRVPHYALAESGAIYHSFQVGRIQFIASDSRYHRSPNSTPGSPSKTMLGQAQKNWMDGVLASSTAEILVWIMPSQWMGTSNDSWAVFRDERDELTQMFGDHGWLRRMFIISGDLHAMAIDSGRGNDWGNFPVYQFGSMDSVYLGAPLGQYDVGGRGGRGQYGLIGITDTGRGVVVDGAGYIRANRWRSHSFNTLPPATISYGQLAPPFEPTEDDQQTANDVTASREGGSSAHVAKQTGPLSIADVGLYDQEVTVNVAADDQLEDQAGWRVHLGTVDEPRYSNVTVNLAVNHDPTPAIAGLDSGVQLTVTDPPDWVSRENIGLIVQGYEETLDAVTWEWTANTTPAEPWTVGVAESDVLGRVDTDGSELQFDINESDTLVNVTVTAGPPWITTTEFPDMFPFDIEVGGEVMRVTGISDTSPPQLFEVTRGVNGVVKSHSFDTPVSLAHPLVLGF